MYYDITVKDKESSNFSVPIKVSCKVHEIKTQDSLVLSKYYKGTTSKFEIEILNENFLDIIDSKHDEEMSPYGRLLIHDTGKESKYMLLPYNIKTLTEAKQMAEEWTLLMVWQMLSDESNVNKLISDFTSKVDQEKRITVLTGAYNQVMLTSNWESSLVYDS